MAGLYRDVGGSEYSVNYYDGIFYISPRGSNIGSYMLDALPKAWVKII